MDISYLPIIFTIIAFLISLASRLIFYKLKGEKKETLEDKISKFTNSLKETSAIITQIESEIEERSKIAKKLQKDIKIYDEAIKAKESEVEAIAQVFRGELIKEGNKSFWKGVFVNFAFFILGAIFTIITGIYLK